MVDSFGSSAGTQNQRFLVMRLQQELKDMGEDEDIVYEYEEDVDDDDDIDYEYEEEDWEEK